MPNLYPIGLIVEGKKCLLIGGGEVAEGKARALLDCGARVTVISPDLTPQLRAWADAGSLTHLPRAYQRGDLEGAFLVCGCTDDNAVNRAVFAEASGRGQLVNIVDVPPLCNFYAQSIIRRGNLLLSIGTDGISPTLARWVRERIEEMIQPEWAEFLEIAARFREEAKARLATPEDRARAWRRLVESDVFELLRQGERQAAEERVRECLFTDRSKGVSVSCTSSPSD